MFISLVILDPYSTYLLYYRTLCKSLGGYYQHQVKAKSNMLISIGVPIDRQWYLGYIRGNNFETLYTTGSHFTARTVWDYIEGQFSCTTHTTSCIKQGVSFKARERETHTDTRCVAPTLGTNKRSGV